MEHPRHRTHSSAGGGDDPDGGVHAYGSRKAVGEGFGEGETRVPRVVVPAHQPRGQGRDSEMSCPPPGQQGGQLDDCPAANDHHPGEDEDRC